MTTPVTPPAAPVVPLYPPLGSATFNADAYTYGTSMPGVVDGINDLAENAHTNALSANESATAAQQSALDATNAAAPALAAANFKGVWSTLAAEPNAIYRHISKPACVKHNGRFWMLLNNLPDIAASEPGVTADWTSLDAGRVTQTITSSITAVPGVYYIATTAGITLTVPDAVFQNGDEMGGRNASDGACYIDWGTGTILGQPPDAPMRWPRGARFETVNNGSTFA